MADALTRSVNRIAQIAERVADDFPAFCYDGFGVMLSDQQVEAEAGMRGFGPRQSAAEPKFHFISGGTRSGKTVLLALGHANACLYKRGVDTTDTRYWNNYLYKTLAVAPTGELTLKLWQVMDEMTKGASDAQFDRESRQSRGGAFLHLLKAGKADQWPVVRFENGARTDFRSSEGYAFRLEGDQWWLFTWDEWASQPDREIGFIKDDVLLSRSRDHDAKIIPAAWPKEATERHLVEQIRRVEAGATDTAIYYLSSMDAHFTNRQALETEQKIKGDASWKRTVLGQPAGGAAIEFKLDVIEHFTRRDLPAAQDPIAQPVGSRFFTSWDIGLAHDDSVGTTWRIPPGGVTPLTKAVAVEMEAVKGGGELTLDHIAERILERQRKWGGETAVDASGLGGVAAFRQVQAMHPRPLAFVSRSNHRIYGNMRLAAITNGIDLATWGRPEVPDELSGMEWPWGLFEIPYIAACNDQLANFDRDAKDVPDDWVWSILIGLWYIRRYWVVGQKPSPPKAFDPRSRPGRPQERRKPYSIRRR